MSHSVDNCVCVCVVTATVVPALTPHHLHPSPPARPPPPTYTHSVPLHSPHPPTPPTAPRALRYADLGGVEEVLADIRELIEYPLKHPEVYR